MAEDEGTLLGSITSMLVSFAGAGVALAGLIGSFTLGPIDLTRTAYNSIVGDVPLIRTRAVEYCRSNIKIEFPGLSERGIEGRLASMLNYDLHEGELINPQEVKMMELWDATENCAPNWYERWVWPEISR